METAVRPVQSGRGGGVLREFQVGLCVPGVLGDVGGGGVPVAAWVEHYNREALHSTLGIRTPAEFYAEWMVKNEKRPVQI